MSFDWASNWGSIIAVKSPHRVDEYLEAHRRMWKWLSENPGKGKFDYEISEEERKRWPNLVCNCFACQFATENWVYFKDGIGSGMGYCEKCLLEWNRGGAEGGCMANGSLYKRYTSAWLEGNLEDVSKLAWRISRLPLSEFAIKMRGMEGGAA